MPNNNGLQIAGIGSTEFSCLQRGSLSNLRSYVTMKPPSPQLPMPDIGSGLAEAEAIRRSRSQFVTLRRGQNLKHLSPWQYDAHVTALVCNQCQ